MVRSSWRLYLGAAMWLAGLFSAVAEQDVPPVSARYHVEFWQTEQGLPHNNVLSIAQFRGGYLWFATARGLVRFDGVRLVNVSPPGLPVPPQEQIRRLHFDSTGNLWMGTQAGALHCWPALQQPGNGPVRRMGTDASGANGAYELCEDGAGRLWMVSELGRVHRMDGDRLQDLGEPGRGRMGPSGLARDTLGTVWLASRGSVGYFDGDTWVEVMADLAPPLAIAPRRAGGVWLLAGQQLFAVERQGGGPARVTIPWPPHDTEVRQMIEDRQGAVWMATNRRGLLRYAEGRLEQVPVHHPSILYVMEDAEGSLWYGTQGGGMGRVRERLFEVISTRDGLRNDIVHSITEDHEGRLWIVSQDGGLAVVKDGVCRSLGAAEGWIRTVPLCVAATPDGVIWVGTFSEGLMRYHAEKTERVPVSPELPGQRINALLADSQGRLWVGFHGQGLSVLDGGHARYLGAALPGMYVTSLAADAGGRVWVGTGDGGIARFDGERMQVVNPAVGGQVVHALLPLSDGRLWAGVSPGGLVCLHQGRRSSVGHAQGLPDDSIFQLQLDGNGWVWCGTARGLFRVSLRDLNAVADGLASSVETFSYGRSEGLADFPFSNTANPATCRARDGRFWFATAKGAVGFAPDRLPWNREPPQVLIEEVFANGVAVNPRESARLPPGTRELEVRFTALSFVAPEKVRFRHRLEGAESDWTEPNLLRRTVLSGLAPGTYRFVVIACNNDGVWNNVGAGFSFTIPPVFWQTRWFIALAACLGVGAVAGLFRVVTVRRLHRRLEKLRQRHALEQERSRIAHDIHDELGASLTQVSMLAGLAARSLDRPEEVAADLKRITGTAQDAVRAMDAIVWAINPANDSLENFAAYVLRFAEDFLPPAGIRLRFDVPTDLPPAPLGTEQRHQLFLVVREALNNIVRHAAAREVWLRMAVRGDRFELHIEDDGRGMAADTAGPGSDGLANMRERVEGLRGAFHCESAPGSGTRIRVSVPLQAPGMDQTHAAATGAPPTFAS